MKGIIYAVNSNRQSATNHLINFGAIETKVGIGVELKDSEIHLIDEGLFAIDVSIAVSVAEPGIISLHLNKDGIEMEGSRASIIINNPESFAAICTGAVIDLTDDKSIITAKLTGNFDEILNASVMAVKA